jgi:hypothetical protein
MSRTASTAEIFVKAHYRKPKNFPPVTSPRYESSPTPRKIIPPSISESKNYLVIQYHEKDDLKDLYPGQLQWDENTKRWFTDNEEVYNLLEPYHVKILPVAYSNKDIGKSLGAKWSGKYWYCSNQQYQSNQESFDDLAIRKTT